MEHTVNHGTFTVEREYPVPVERVWDAWTTAEKKRKWFAQDPGFTAQTNEFSLDFRVGGVEKLDATLLSGRRLQLETVFGDIVDNERIVATYEVLIDGDRLSVSIWSMQLFPTATGTRLVTTEHGAYLDGRDDNESRMKGTKGDLEMLAKYLEETATIAA
jgi:uncharacterized protein YndB with AHSA1/START domain